MKGKSYSKRSLIRSLVSVLLILAVLLGDISIPKDIFADPPTGNDVTALLKPKMQLRLFQDGNEINLANDSEVQGGKPLQLNIDMGIPVQWDDPTPSEYVGKGDTAEFEIVKGLNLIDSAWMNLTFQEGDKTYKVGEAKFYSDNSSGVDIVKLKIAFTGNSDTGNAPSITYEDENIFETHQEVHAKFNATFNLDISSLPPNEGGTVSVTILEKEYQFTVPAPNDTITVTKTGEVKTDDPDNRSIEWTIIVGSNAEVLDGYRLEDELASVGEYVSGSFKVKYNNGTTDQSFSPAADPYDAASKKISYRFEKNNGESINQPATVTFQTRLTEEEFLAKTPVEKKNRVTVYKEDEKKAEHEAAVTWKPKWIQKFYILQEGNKPYRKVGNDYYIDWLVKVNEEKASLKNVVIKDSLIKKKHAYGDIGYELDFISAQLKIFDAEGQVLETRNYKVSSGAGELAFPSITPVSPDIKYAEFNVGTLNGKAELRIETKVVIPSSTTEEQFLAKDNLFRNEASVKWEHIPSAHPTAGTSVIIGDRSVSKTVPADGIFAYAKFSEHDSERVYIKRETTWHVKVQDKNITSDTTAYDMIIHDTGVLRANIENGDLRLEDGADNIDGILLKNLKPEANPVRYYRFKERSLKSDNVSLVREEKKLFYNGRHVGYLLKVSGFATGKVNDFTFVTTIEDPDLLINPDPDVYNSTSNRAPNTVYVTKGGNLENKHTYWPKYISRMLEKEVLSVTDAQQFRNDRSAANANLNIGKDQSTVAFDHVTKSVLYRLSVNAEEVKGMGDLVVKDTLPDGWKLKNYWIFEGDSKVKPLVAPHWKLTTEQALKEQSYAGVLAKNNFILYGTGSDSSSSAVRVHYDQSASLLSFTFPNIDRAYVILLEAGPDDATLIKYLKDPKHTDVSNKAQLYLKAKPANVITKTQGVRVDVKAILKGYEHVPEGVLKWHIDYTPYNMIEASPSQDVKIEDTLLKGIDLRRDTDNGNLIFVEEDGSANFWITELNVGANGTKTEGNPVPEIQAYISYQHSPDKILSFKVPDPTKAYRFYYITDLTGDENSKVANKVKLTSSSVTAEYQPPTAYVITQADASAYATRSAKLELLKVDKNTNRPLQGAKFCLRAYTGTWERTFTSNASGKAVLKNIPIGTYVLTEETPPSGYKPNTNSYEVTVKKVGAALAVAVEGVQGLYTITNEKEPAPSPADPGGTGDPPSKPIIPPTIPPSETTSTDKPDQTPDNKPPTPPDNNPTKDPFGGPDEEPTVLDVEEEPSRPIFTRGELPDPNDPDSPDQIEVVDEDGIPLGTYEKKENPDGTFEYVLVDDDVPLDIPKTGNENDQLYFKALFIVIILAFMKKRKA